MPAPKAEPQEQAEPLAETPICGLIMPISATASHSAEHWAAVQTLLHRAISKAGFDPVNVWQNSSTDRVSERIIGNLFEFPLMLADISDLNPNVMLELGMRLSSRKPTIVVVNKGGEIPFDIRDFHAVMYPSDMNMLGMEEFFDDLSKALNDKYTASKLQGYTPFLGSIVVDVLSPQEREVGINELLLDRMADIAKKVSALEASPSQRKNRTTRPFPSDTKHVSTFDGYNGEVYFTIPTRNIDQFKDAVKAFQPKELGPFYAENDTTYGVVKMAGVKNGEQFSIIKDDMSSVVKKFGCSLGIPDSTYEFYSW